MPVDVWAQDTLAFSGVEARRVDSLLVMPDGTALGSRHGVRPGDPGLTTTLAGAVINVSAGVASVYRSGQGLYRVALPSSVSPGSHNAAHATLPRIDLVYLRVWDTDVDASGLRKGDVVYLAGTAAGSPVAPTPGGTEIYIPLATISVPASGGGSATVSTTVKPVTVAPGGIVPDAAAAGYYAGQYRDDGTGLQRYDGSAWGYPAAQGVGKTLWARKTANTSRASTGTVTADPHLTLSVVAGATYKIDCFLVYDADSASDLKVSWSAPSGTTGAWWPGATDSSVNALAFGARWGGIEDIGTTTMAIGALGAGTVMACRLVGTAVTTNAGTFALTWAQQSGGATATILHTHSFLHLSRVA